MEDHSRVVDGELVSADQHQWPVVPCHRQLVCVTAPVGKEFRRGMRAQMRNPRLGRICRVLSRSVDDHPQEVFLRLRCSYSMAKDLMVGMKFSML